MDLNPHADFDAALFQTDSVFLGKTADPARAHSARCQNNIVRGIGLTVGDDAVYPLIIDQHIFDFFRCVNYHLLGFDVIAYGDDVVRQAVTAQMFLFDNKQIDPVRLCKFADF